MSVLRLLYLSTLASASAHLRRSADASAHLQADAQATQQQLDSPAMQLFNVASSQLRFMKYMTSEQAPAAHPLTYTINILADVAIVAALAYLYFKYRTVPMEDPAKSALDEEEMQDWKHGICAWYQTPGICCMACCCPSIRWSETISMLKGSMPFWTAFFIVFMWNKFNSNMGVWTVFDMPFAELGVLAVLVWSCLMILYISYRQRLREHFNFKSKGGRTYLTDFLLYAFCYPCAITQEARHVEEAIERGHQAAQVPEGRRVAKSK